MATNRVLRVCGGLALTVLCGFTLGGESGCSELGRLAWIAGHWAETVGDVHMEEIWTEARGGVMLGVHRDVRAGGAAFFEYLRIEDRGGQTVYIASPMGRESTEFALALVEDRRAIFENLDHDFPQRIIYRRDGDRLSARAEGIVNGDLRGEDWEWRLERCVVDPN
jgi:hypothetical protein